MFGLQIFNLSVQSGLLPPWVASHGEDFCFATVPGVSRGCQTSLTPLTSLLTPLTVVSDVRGLLRNRDVWLLLAPESQSNKTFSDVKSHKNYVMGVMLLWDLTYHPHNHKDISKRNVKSRSVRICSRFGTDL